jgi:hypothetical protein
MHYIYNSVTQFCEGYLKGRLNIIRPEDPQSVVSRSAAMPLLGTRVVRLRRAWVCFGVKVHKAFDGGNWEARFIYNCPVGGLRVDCFVAWHLHKVSLQRPRQTIPYLPLNRETRSTLAHSATPVVHGYSTLDEDDPEG